MTIIAKGTKTVKVTGVDHTERNGDRLTVIPPYDKTMKLYQDDVLLMEIVGKYTLDMSKFNEIKEVEDVAVEDFT